MHPAATSAFSADIPAQLRAAVGGILEERVRTGAVPLPCLPDVTRALRRATAEGTSLSHVASLVAHDRALAALVLQVARAGVVGDADPITSVADAVQRLGPHQVERISWCTALVALAQRPGPLRALRMRQLRESLVSATVCDALARVRGLDDDACWLAGLVHDFGAVVCLQLIEEILGSVAGARTDLCVALAQRHHVDVSLALAEAWDLPRPVPEVVGAHHLAPIASGAAPVHEVLVASDAVLLALRSASLSMTVELLSTVEELRSRDEAVDVLCSLAELSRRMDALCGDDLVGSAADPLKAFGLAPM
jgi:HD-like signal output (HDOD) protein